jgi:hypothetical protein
VRVSTEYYDVADKLAPKERAQYLESSGVHVILGPRRSEQYLVATHGLSRTPIVSTAASANDVQDLSPPFFTMFPYIEDFVSAALKTLSKEKYSKTYASAYDVTCLACRDYQKSFEKMALKKGYKNQFSLEVASDKPDLTPLIETIRREKVGFLLIPAYPKTAAFIIASLQTEFPHLRYVGTHSWGDAAYGFLEDYKIAPHVKGFAVNATASSELMGKLYNVWSLDRDSKTGPFGPPASGYRVIDFIRIMTRDLCALKKNKKMLSSKQDFHQFFGSLPKTHFQRKDHMGVFRLENGDFQYSHQVDL